MSDPLQLFDRVARQSDGTFQHFYRGEPVTGPGLVPESQPHGWPYGTTCAGCSQWGTACACGTQTAGIRAELAALDPLGVPDVLRATLLRQAEEMEQHFGLDERLEVAYIADNLRVAAGAPPKHGERTSGQAVAATDALVALADLERAAKAGPASPTAVAELVAKVRAALLK